MHGIRNGDDKAFAALYDRYSPRMARYFAVRLGGNQMTVEDAVHDLFFKIIDKPHLFDVNKKFSTWIFTVAMNMCKNEYRRRQVRSKEFFLDESEHHTQQFKFDFDVEQQFDFQLLNTEINAGLEKLDAAKKDTFIFRFQQQLSLAEIADIMNCSVGTVKSRLFYTIRALADQLEEFNPNVRS